MEICTLASGSTGNCTLVRNCASAVLIDAGISLRRITRSLCSLGLSMKDLDGIVITHEHSDHITALKMIIKYSGVPIFAPSGSAGGILRTVPEAEERVGVFEAGTSFELGSFLIRSFPTPHDVPESVGYRFDDGQSVFALATDLGHIPREVFDGVTGAAAAVIESNHDVEMLQNGSYPYYLKRRILSDSGHLSNDACGDLALALAETGTRKIILGHLSQENNTPSTALRTVGAALSAGGFVPGRDVELYAAPAYEPGEIYIV
ncbi:MAG: MBL fold metallo-hydrolase [Oscillospiraceae bacterium]